MKFIFILVSPQLPENVGAAARAMNTMGFDFLRLVNPCDYRGERARWMAFGSEHILEQALVFDTFTKALHDIDFVIGATARRRGKRRDYFSGEQLPHLIASKGETIHTIGVVFGREDRGLLNEEIEKCDALVTVPMRATYPSLNLAQAVMVFCYILSPFVLNPIEKKPTSPPANEFHVLKNRIHSLLVEIGFENNSNIVNRLIERLGHLSQEDIHILHSVCTKLERKITR